MSWRGRLRRTLPYVVAITGGFLLAYLLVAFVVFPSGVVPQDLRVPNVIGLDYDDASQRLTQSGFTAEQGETRFHASAPKGTVLEQTPPPGAKELSGASITLVVSAGQRMGTVPVVSGMTREDAERAIRSEGFDIIEVAEEAGTLPAGAAAGTRPTAGTQMPTPGDVTLIISSGPTVVITPDLVGQNFSEAQVRLAQAGLSLGAVTTEGGAVAEGAAMVVAQSPAAGAQVARGARIDLRLGAP